MIENLYYFSFLFRMKYRRDIDGLRAIAVCSVLIFHTFPSVLPGGFVGVDIFFVISGYLITSIIYNELKENSFSLSIFYCRRVRRIFPALIIVLISCYIIGWHLLYSDEYKKLGIHISAAASFSTNFLLYSESDYFDEESNTKPLLHLWSLAIEEQFYIVWPLLCSRLCIQIGRLHIVALVLTLCSFISNIIIVQTNRSLAFYSPMTRSWELLIGACLALRSDQLELLKNKAKCNQNNMLFCTFMGAIGLSLIGASIVFLNERLPFPSWWAVFPTVGTLLLIAIEDTSWINTKILSSRLFVEIGRISYSLYLWHWPLIVFWRIYDGGEPSSFARFNIIGLSILLAWLNKIFIENPMRFGSFPRLKFTISCLLMISLGIIGYQTYKFNGFPHRFTNVSLPFLDIKLDRDSLYKDYRFRTCFLDTERTEWKFGSCVDNPNKPKSDGVILWGDSHAAHLYPGIKSLEPKVRFTQLTAGLCPPMFSIPREGRAKCRDINQFIFKRITDEKPKTVILAGYWMSYTWKEESLTETIISLRNVSVKDIYLFGPVPLWKSPLKQCLFTALSKQKLSHDFGRTNQCLKDKIKDYDEKMQIFATKHNISYISPYQISCNSNGCMVLVGEKEKQLTTFDGSHLTKAGSIFIASHFPKNLLKTLLAK